MMLIRNILKNVDNVRESVKLNMLAVNANNSKLHSDQKEPHVSFVLNQNFISIAQSAIHSGIFLKTVVDFVANAVRIPMKVSIVKYANWLSVRNVMWLAKNDSIKRALFHKSSSYLSIVLAFEMLFQNKFL